MLKFFLNSNTSSYLRGLADEFNESTNAVRVELNRLEAAGMLSTQMDGNKKLFSANTRHPLFKDIQGIVHKHLGIDQLILNVIERLGDIEKAYLTGPFANGLDAQIIDVVLVGEPELEYLNQLIVKVEKIIKRRIRYIHYHPDQWSEKILSGMEVNPLLIWEKKTETV